MNLKNIVTIICALYNSRTITLQQAMALLEKYISQMGNNSGSGTGTEPAQSTGLLDTTNHNAYVPGRTATTFVPNGTLTRVRSTPLASTRWSSTRPTGSGSSASLFITSGIVHSNPL